MFCIVQYRLTEEISRIVFSKHYRPLYCKVDINIYTFGRQIYSKKVSQFIVNNSQLKKVNRVIIKFSDEEKTTTGGKKKNNSYKYTIEIYSMYNIYILDGFNEFIYEKKFVLLLVPLAYATLPRR